MSRGKIPSASKPASPFYRRNDLGFTLAQSSAAAAANARSRITAHPLGFRGLFSQLLLAYVDSDHRPLATFQGKVAPADDAALNILPQSEPRRGDEQAFCDRLLSPSANDDALRMFDATWKIGRNRHVSDLLWLRGERPEAFRLIVTGKMRRACRIIEKEKESSLKDRLTAIVRKQAILFAINFAHQRIAYLKHLAQRPYGTGFAGYKTWLTVGHVLLATIWSPAAIVVEIGTSPLLKPGLELDEAEQLRIARQRHWIPDDANGRWLVEQARQVAKDYHLSVYGRTFVQDMLMGAVESARSAATLTRSDLRANGYSFATFAHLGVGVSVPEACIFIATELEQAFLEIPRMVASLVGSASLYRPSQKLVPAELVMRTQVLLRSEGRPDRHAINLSAVDAYGFLRTEITQGDHAGHLPLRRLKKKVAQDAALQARLREMLGLPTAALFR
jgi:hypothetical protein